MGNNEENSTDKATVIRKDGGRISEEGYERLVAGGHKGHDIFERNTEEKLGGTRHNILRPLDRDAAFILKEIKDWIQRAKFLSKAIVDENARRKSWETK